MTRRTIVLSMVMSLGVAAIAAVGAQQDPTTLARIVRVQKLKDNLYVLTGGGGNTVAFITANGVVVVDTKLAGWGQPILDQIKTVTNKPVTMIINTHTHGDHVGGNPEFPATVDIVAQENTKANMEKMPPFQSDSGKQYLPKRTFKDKMSLLGGDDRIDLYYFGRGHTNGDALVVFPALRVMHSGDLFPGKQAPIMDTGNGGSGVDYPATLAAAAKGISGVDTVIPGHSDVTDWKAFVEFGQFMDTFVGAARTALTSGHGADDAAATISLPPQYKDYDMSRLKADVEVIASELKSSGR
jgi:glyoxylase-like metal-dependent hydrolase (beta-lactamase superfamily II)